MVLYHNVLERELLSSLLSIVPSLHLTLCKVTTTLPALQYDLVVTYCKDLMNAYQCKMHMQEMSVLLLLPASLKQMNHLLEDGKTRVVNQGCAQHQVLEAVSFLLSNERQVHEGKSEHITKRERQILSLLLSGLDTRAIAETLGIKVSTVTVHKKHLFYKSGVHSTSQLLVWALFTQISC